MRRERERLVIRHREDDEAAAAVADGGIDLVEVTDEKLVLLGAVRI
jgi:hypothetical protein